MSADHAKHGSTGDSSSNVKVWIAIIAAIGFFLIGTRIDPLYRAAGGSPPATEAGDATDAALTANTPPPTEMPLPDGPNIDDFQNSCLLCHSARLPLGQPPFGREKWGEIDHKMATAYGAQITPAVESKVVDYLVKVRPPES